MQTPPSNEEALVPFPSERRLVRDATHFRSTWMTSSMTCIRERGHFERYAAYLDPKYKDEIVSCVAGVWLPMEVALAHYGACERLDLPTNELVEIGEAATRRASATFLSFVSRMAGGAGVTPWTVLRQAPRLWGHTCDGGAVAVYRLGPKDARVEIVGFALARYRYNVQTMRGIVQAVAKGFCTKAYAREIASRCTSSQIAIRLSWV